MASADFTIADVLRWARTKSGSYNYIDNSNCAMCQFLRETGRARNPSVIPRFWNEEDHSAQGAFSDEIEDCLKPEGLFDEDTFANLVKRLEKLCPEIVVTPSDWSRLDAYLTDIEDVARERLSA